MNLLDQIRPQLDAAMAQMKNLSVKEAEQLNELLDKFRG